MKYILLRSFIKKFDSYGRQEQESIVLTMDKIKKYLETKHTSYGLRVKKLSKRIYEARINIHLRIAYFYEKDIVRFFCLGNHDDIRFCLKILKSCLKSF